jgi:hypothetical protein
MATYEFQSVLYPTWSAMVDAVAYEWLSAGGANNLESMREEAARGAACLTAECIDGWGLDRQDDDGADWMSSRDMTQENLQAAFERLCERILAGTTIQIINPWSGAVVNHDITGLTEAQLDAYAQVMDDEIREALHSSLAPCKPEEFLAAYVERVGPEEGGRIVLGS